jgi:hypothetical protein
LSYPIDPSIQKNYLFLSYQASLAYNPKEFLGEITNWRHCRGEEFEAQLPWETTRSNFDDRQSLDIYLVVIIYLATP